MGISYTYTSNCALTGTDIMLILVKKTPLKVNQDTEKLLFSKLSDFLSLKSDRYKYFLSPQSLNLTDDARE